MDRITRKNLKDDKFAAEVTHSVEYIAGHRRQATLYGGIGVAVLAVALGIFLYWQHRQNAAHQGLYKALETHHALISEDDRPGRVTYKTEEQKTARALVQFSELARNYPRSTEGRMARYYIGVIQFEMGKTAEAQKQLEQVIGEGQDSILALARLSLAEVYVAQGKHDEAGKIYDYLLKQPTDTVSESRVKLAMVRHLQSRNKPEEARKLLMELLKTPGVVAAAAGNMLRELPQQ